MRAEVLEPGFKRETMVNVLWVKSAGGNEGEKAEYGKDFLRGLIRAILCCSLHPGEGLVLIEGAVQVVAPKSDGTRRGRSERSVDRWWRMQQRRGLRMLRRATAHRWRRRGAHGWADYW